MKTSLHRGCRQWIAFAVLLTVPALTGSAESLFVTVKSDAPAVSAVAAGGARLDIPGCQPGGAPGEPALPTREIRIAVPPDIDWSTLRLKVAAAKTEDLPAAVDVAPALPDLPGAPGGAAAPVPQRNPAVYALNTPYPASPARLLPYAQMRKWRIARVEFTPVQWVPAAGLARVNREVTLELQFERLAAPAAAAPALAAELADTVMDGQAAEMLANFDEAKAWYVPTKAEAGAASFVANYVIITTTAITNNCAKLQEYVRHLQDAKGHTVRILTEVEINAVVGAQAPNHRAEKIRKWLKDNYVSWGIQYLLLIGNPTPYENGEGDVPMKMTWPQFTETSDREAPTDMFFGDLTGNWDPDGDQNYGEWTDYTAGGGVDLTVELWVGRIPVYSADYAGLRDILQKILDYDREWDVAWRRSTLLPMSFSGAGYDGAPLAAQMWDDYLSARAYTRWRMFQQGSGPCGPDSAYVSDQELRGGTLVRDRWAANDYGVVCWWAHGSATSAGVGYDGCWDGDLFNSGQCAALDDDHPSFVYQCSCLNGYPENSNNLQYQLLRRGSIGAVSATRVSFFNTGVGYGSFDGSSINAGIGYEYIRRLTDHQAAGPALSAGKLAVVGDIGSRATRLMNQFDFNLYGDPSSSLDATGEYYPTFHNEPLAMVAVPRRYSFNVYDFDWAGIAMRPASEDHDLKADTDAGLPSPYATSTAGGVIPDFVVANGHSFGNGLHYAEVFLGGDTPYTIEAENNIDDLSLNVWSARTLRTNDVFDLTEVSVSAGRTYEVTADLTSGANTLTLLAFGPGRTAGSRQDYDAISTTGSGGDRQLTYTAPVAGYLGLVVLNTTAAAGNYSLRVRDATPLAAPATCSATDGTLTDRVTVTWSAVAGASYYRVYRSIVNDSSGAAALTGWITGTTYDDTSADPGTCYYYWVTAAEDSLGFRAGDFSPGDSGYVQPPTLLDDIKVDISADPSYHRFIESNPYWVAVGVRANSSADNWSMILYSTPDFRTQLVASAYVVPVDFVVVDRNHAPSVYRGIESYRFSGSGGAALEFDGSNEQFSVGTNPNISWPAGDVVEMRDIYLTGGTYRVTLDVTAGSADLDIGLFGSGDGNYYRNREQYLGRSTQVGGGLTEIFYVSVTNTDWYGVCVWANDANSATYSVEVVPVAAGLWEGDVSEDWHLAGNWNNNAVPGAGNDVTIPPGTPFSPRVYRQLAYCSNLTVQAGATLTINTNELYAGGNANIHGLLNMNSTLARFHLAGDMVWEPGSTASMIGSARILVTGDWNFEDGANVQLTSGYVEFEGAGTSFIRCYDEDCNLYNLLSSKYAPNALGVSGLSTKDLPINNLYIYGGAAFYCYSSYGVIIRGFMNNMGGTFQWPYGSAVFTGNPGVVPIKPTADSYFGDLVQSGTGPLVLDGVYTNYLRVARSLTIRSNAIDCAGLGLWVGGNWSNLVGRSGFLCRTGSVTFTGSNSQYVYGSNVFHTVWDARGGVGTLWMHGDIVVSNAHHVTSIHGAQGRLDVLGTLDLNSPGGQFGVYAAGTVTAANFDQGGHLYGIGGSFTAADLVDESVCGRYTMLDGNVTLNQDEMQYTDLDAILEISGGTLRVVGGGDVSYWPYATNASLTMSDGVLDFDGPGIRVNNSLLRTLTNNITGGRIRASGHFLGWNAAFNPPGGELEMYGSTDQSLFTVAGSSLHRLIINKAGAKVTDGSNLVLSADFVVESGSFVAPPEMQVGGNWSNGVGTAGFVEGTGTVVFAGANFGDILTDETFHRVELDKTYSGFDALELADDIRVTVSNILTCTDGSLEMNRNSTLNVRSNLVLALDAGLNANDVFTKVFVGGHWQNYNTNFSIYNGFDAGNRSRVTFDRSNGGDRYLSTAAAQEEFWDVVIDRPGGSLRPFDNIHVSGELVISNGWWSSLAANLQHELRGDVYVHTTGAWGDSAPGNVVRFSGPYSATINYQGASGYFPNITVDKSGGAGVTLLSDLFQLGGVGLVVAQGTYDLNGHLDRLTGSAIVSNGATLTVDAGAELDILGGSNIVVCGGGRLEVLGEAGNPALITRQSGNYGIQIQSNGTIAARHAVFEYMDANGVYVMNGALVDTGATFDDCTFRYGIAGGTLLRADNAQTFTSMRAVFPNNAGGGASNVRKTLSQGHVYMRDATGVFAGEAYDSDAFNLIDWTYGTLASVALDAPAAATLGGTYLVRADVAPSDASEPVVYTWLATENPPVQHTGGVSQDVSTVGWTTPGTKIVRVIASNSWGAVTASQSVAVQLLWFSSIRSMLDVGGKPMTRIEVQGTSADSQYEIQCTPDPRNEPWLPIYPHGSGWSGFDGGTVWFDVSTDFRPIASLTNLFYRAVLLPPDLRP